MYYRGRNCPALSETYFAPVKTKFKGYPEHNKEYLGFCCKLLKERVEKAPEGKYKDLEVKKLMKFIQGEK